MMSNNKPQNNLYLSISLSFLTASNSVKIIMMKFEETSNNKNTVFKCTCKPHNNFKKHLFVY